MDCEFNAIIYDKDDLVSCHSLFNDWFHNFMKIKPLCKGNILFKHLVSSLWGSLCKLEMVYKTVDELMDMDVSMDNSSEYKLINETHFENGYIRFELIKTEKPYKYNLARLKPFVLALSRNVVGDFIMDNNLMNNIIRIHTDGIVLNEEIDFTDPLSNVPNYYPKPEEKTTGNIKWVNVNKYEKLSINFAQ
jgi:hypothetical protein